MTANFTVDCTCGRRVVIDSDTMRKVETVVLVDGDDDYTPPPLKECSVEDCIAGLNSWEEAEGTCWRHTPDEYGILLADCYCSQGSDNADVDVCHLHWAAIRRDPRDAA